jgi:hypothetical protein
MIFHQLVEVPLVLEQQHRPVPGIAHGFADEDAAHLLQSHPATRHPMGHGKSQGLQTDLQALFAGRR